MTPLRQRMIDDMRLAGFAERTRDVYIQAVRRLAAHYMRSPDLLSEEEVRTYLLYLRDERAILAQVRNPIHRASFQLMYACGLRIGEAAKVEVRDIESAEGLLRVIGKGDKERRVPLPEAMLAELRRLWPAHHNPRWVTPNRSGTGPVSKNALWRTFRLSVRAAGIKRPISPHSLRHSYASRRTICRPMVRRCCPRTGVPSPTSSPAERTRSAGTCGAAITAAPRPTPIIPAKTGAVPDAIKIKPSAGSQRAMRSCWRAPISTSR